MIKKYFYIPVIAILILSAYCTQKNVDQDRLKVFTSIIPQQYFVQKIGQDRVSVETLVGPGKSPATYEPTMDQLTSLRKAKVLFTIGVPFEKGLLPKIKPTLKSLKIVDTSQGIKKRYLDAHDHHDDHDHADHNDDHEEKGGKIIDPHIWLSPLLVKKQARTIYDALVKIDPDGKETYQSGFKKLQQELDGLHSELQQALKPLKGKTIFVFHPAFGYFADEYGLKQVAIEVGGKEPSPAALHKVIKEAQKKNVKVLFVQPEFSKKSAKAIADAIGGSVIMLNPLSVDYINNLKNIANILKKST